MQCSSKFMITLAIASKLTSLAAGAAAFTSWTWMVIRGFLRIHCRCSPAERGALEVVSSRKGALWSPGKPSEDLSYTIYICSADALKSPSSMAQPEGKTSSELQNFLYIQTSVGRIYYIS